MLAPGDTVIADSGDHASILDGCMLSRARLRPFRHNRLDKLEQMLERAAGDGGGVLVVVDGVYSMEGDVCDAARVAELCRAHGARLMVDEAHGVGVLGARGAGACELFGVEDEVDLRMGTFSKSLASCGGFIAGPRRGDRLPADPVARLPVHGRRRCPRRSAPRSRPCGSAARPRARELFARVLDNAALPAPRPAGARLPRRRAHAAAGRRRPWSPRSCPSSSATTGRRRCSGRRSRTTACTPTSRSTRRSRPGGALIRTSVMATHERRTSTARWTRLRRSRPPSKANTDRCRGRPRCGPELVHFRTNGFQKKNPALSARLGGASVDPGCPPGVASARQGSAVASGEGGLSGVGVCPKTPARCVRAASVDVPMIPSSLRGGNCRVAP